jgi:hypothetical protein
VAHLSDWHCALTLLRILTEGATRCAIMAESPAVAWSVAQVVRWVSVQDLGGMCQMDGDDGRKWAEAAAASCREEEIDGRTLLSYATMTRKDVKDELGIPVGKAEVLVDTVLARPPLQRCELHRVQLCAQRFSVQISVKICCRHYPLRKKTSRTIARPGCLSGQEVGLHAKRR